MLTSAPRSRVLSIENFNIMITIAPSKSRHTDNVQIDDIDNSRIVEDVHMPFEVINDVVDDLVKSSAPAFDETHVHEERNNDIRYALVESSTSIPNDIDVLEDDTSDFEHVLVEFNMPVQVAKYSLVIPMIEDGIKHETVDTSIVTSSKLSVFSCADCGYVVASYFFFSSESVEFFTIVHHVTPSVSSFSECLELFSDFRHISVGLIDVYR